MGAFDKPARSIETEKLGRNAGVCAQEAAGDEAMDSNPLIDGLQLIASFEKGGEYLGVERSKSASDGRFEVGDDGIEGLEPRMGTWGWGFGDQEWGWVWFYEEGVGIFVGWVELRLVVFVLLRSSLLAGA